MNLLSALKKYDEEYDQWMNEVLSYLPGVAEEELQKFDPAGCFDGSMSAADFAQLVKEG